MTAAHDRRPSTEQGDRGPKPLGDRGEVGDRTDRTEADREPFPKQTTAEPQRKASSWFKRHRFATAILALAALATIAAGVAWWLNARHYEDTDDAFIDARPSAISPQVSGAIINVPVTDNQIVEPGETLVKLDDRDYTAAQAQANALVAQAQATISSAAAQTDAQQPRSTRCRCK